MRLEKMDKYNDISAIVYKDQNKQRLDKNR